MDEKIKIDRIEIRIGSKTISLTPAQMRELKDVLNTTFPDSRTVYVPVPTAPIYIPPVPAYPTYNWWHTQITCLEDSSVITFSTET